MYFYFLIIIVDILHHLPQLNCFRRLYRRLNERPETELLDVHHVHIMWFFNLELGCRRLVIKYRFDFRKHRYTFRCDVQIGIEMITVPGLVFLTQEGKSVTKKCYGHQSDLLSSKLHYFAIVLQAVKHSSGDESSLKVFMAFYYALISTSRRLSSLRTLSHKIDLDRARSELIG